MAKTEQHIDNINAIESKKRIQKNIIITVIILFLAYIFLFRPDIPESVSDKVIENIKDLTSRIKTVEKSEKESAIVNEEPVINKTVEVIKQTDTTVLKIGAVNEFKGHTIILTYVNSKETYCMIRVNDESVLITKGNTRDIGNLKIEVIEPITSPKEMCNVIMT